MFIKEAIALAKPTVEAIKKISKRGINPLTGAKLTVPEWKWEPKVGEWCFPSRSFKKIHLIAYIDSGHFKFMIGTGFEIRDRTVWKNAIPLLHWEKIEEILEGMGYDLSVLKYESYVECYIHQKDVLLVTEQRKTHQLAVMRAVIELGKEHT